MELVSCKIILSRKNIFFETIQIGDKSECSRFEQSSVIKSLLAEKCKPYEIYRRMCDVHGEAFLLKKRFTKRLAIGLPESKRESVVLKYTDFPVKEKFRGQK